MTVYVADHAWTWISSDQLKAAGYVGDIGYCSYDTTGKNWTPAQIKDRIGAGLQVGINWETAGMRSLSGVPGAQSDAPEFLRQAKSLGATGGFLMVNLEDPQPTDPSNYPVMTQYAAEMRRQIQAAGFSGIVGYGSDRAMSYILANGGIDRKWVVETWPRGSWNPDLLQYANSHPLNTWNGDIDCNLAASADWPHALFFGAQGGPEVLDPNDPIVQEIRTSLHGIYQVLYADDAAKDDAGNPIPDHWAIGYTLSAVRQVLARLNEVPAGSPPSSPDPQALADKVVAELVAHSQAPLHP